MQACWLLTEIALLLTVDIKKRDQFALHRRNEDNYQIVETFKIIDVVSSEGIDIKRIQFCEDQVVILSEDSIYRFKVGEIKTEFNVM